MKGRKPIPTALADLHGRPRHNKAPRSEPKPVGDLDEPPAWMTDDQKDGWRYAIQHASPGLLKRIDRSALTAWVIAEDIHRQAVIMQAASPLLIKAPKTGVLMQSLYLPIINRQALIMLKAASELGFSPTARPRIGAMSDAAARSTKRAVKDQPTKPLDDFLDENPLSETIN
jgi:P27 family predicted phage terminase small subunit